MSPMRTAVAAIAALALAACAIGRPVPQATTYLIEPVPGATPGVAKRIPESLRMGQVRVAAAFAGPGLVYRTGDVAFTSDPYHAFLAEPGAMVGSRMAEWLDRAGPFQSVAQPETASATSLVLEATVTELYGDFRPGRPPAAVMTVQFTLLDWRDRERKAPIEWTIGRRVELAQADPAALVRGYGAALGAILAELASALDHAERSTVAAGSRLRQ